MSKITVITLSDVITNYGESFLPLDDANEINYDKVNNDIEYTHVEIERYLQRADISLPLSDNDLIAQLKPIALDIIGYRLTNRDGESGKIYETRMLKAITDLKDIVKGYQMLSEKGKAVGLQSVKIFR